MGICCSSKVSLVELPSNTENNTTPNSEATKIEVRETNAPDLSPKPEENATSDTSVQRRIEYPTIGPASAASSPSQQDSGLGPLGETAPVVQQDPIFTEPAFEKESSSASLPLHLQLALLCAVCFDALPHHGVLHSLVPEDQYLIADELSSSWTKLFEDLYEQSHQNSDFSKLGENVSDSVKNFQDAWNDLSPESHLLMTGGILNQLICFFRTF